MQCCRHSDNPRTAGAAWGNKERMRESNPHDQLGRLRNPAALISAFAGGRRARLSVSDRESSRFTVRPGTQRARRSACDRAIELARDYELDVADERSVQAEDEFAPHRSVRFHGGMPVADTAS